MKKPRFERDDHETADRAIANTLFECGEKITELKESGCFAFMRQIVEYAKNFDKIVGEKTTFTESQRLAIVLAAFKAAESSEGLSTIAQILAAQTMTGIEKY